jgi:multimeric flavodoxin WrbA
MKLTVFNGSSRGNKSNTTKMLTPFIHGFESMDGNIAEMIYLSGKLDAKQPVEKFLQSDIVLLAFPLYVDSMPGMVKMFIESLAPYCGRDKNPTMAYFIHCGFPEPLHCRYVERYLEKLTIRLGCDYAGSMVRGGTEGVRLMSEKMNRSLFSQMRQLGADLGSTGRFQTELLNNLAGRECYPAITGFVLPIMTKLGLTTGYWDQELKKHNAYKQHDAKPYA